jgi:hypothetical protein
VHATIDKPDGVVFRCTLDGSGADRWLDAHSGDLDQPFRRISITDSD